MEGMPAPHVSLEQQILQYYESGREADRLESPFSRWEKLRTLDLLDRFRNTGEFAVPATHAERACLPFCTVRSLPAYDQTRLTGKKAYSSGGSPAADSTWMYHARC